MLWRWQRFEIWAIESVINVIFVKAAVPTWPVIVAVNVHPKWWLYILSVNRKRNWIRAKRYRRIWPALGIKLPSSEVEVWNLTPTRFPLFYCLGKKKNVVIFEVYWFIRIACYIWCSFWSSMCINTCQEWSISHHVRVCKRPRWPNVSKKVSFILKTIQKY